jgi:copper chaperone NosL
MWTQTKQGRRLPLILLVALAGCSSAEVRPVEIYEEDSCSFCRMAISDHRFAGEIIADAGDVFKFDDLGCMNRFVENRPAGLQAASFVIDYDSGVWISKPMATIVRTGIVTPMNSGLVAFADPDAANRCAEEYPPEVQ